MAKVLSNITKAITSADSLRVRTQVLRGSVLETVCDCRAWDADGATLVAAALAAATEDAFLLAPIKLHDRIAGITTRVTAQGTTGVNYVLALYGVGAASGPKLITTFGPATLIPRLGSGATDVTDEISLLPGDTSTTFGLKDGTIWQVMTPAQKKAVKDSEFKNSSSFILGLKPGAAVDEAAVKGLVITLRTVEGAPSTQDASITV